MKKEKRLKHIISTFSNFFVFLLLAAFVTTCCIMLFISALQDTSGRDFTAEEIAIAAKITLVNVILISIVMAAVDHLRRKFTVERPVKRITEATSRMMAGDFNRVKICKRRWLQRDYRLRKQNGRGAFGCGGAAYRLYRQRISRDENAAFSYAELRHAFADPRPARAEAY